MNDEPASPFAIDETHLDREWLCQPKLTRRAGIREADAQHEVAQAKANLDVVEADLRRAIRRNPEKYGLKPDKPTEGSIGEVVTLERKYQAALAELNDKKHAADICAAEVSAMMDRRRALERLVELLAMDYYSEPRARNADSRTAVANGSKNAARSPVRSHTE